MKSLTSKYYNAYRAMKDLNQQIALLEKEKGRLKATVEEGFGKALTVVAPDGLRIEKKLVHQEVSAHTREFYRYVEG